MVYTQYSVDGDLGIKRGTTATVDNDAPSQHRSRAAAHEIGVVGRCSTTLGNEAVEDSQLRAAHIPGCKSNQ